MKFSKVTKHSALFFMFAGSLIAAQHLENKVEIKNKTSYRLIVSNGIPDHTPGQFPNRGNPHSLSEQSYTFKVPLKPKEAKSLTALGKQPFGVGLNGVPFDPSTAEVDRASGWVEEAIVGGVGRLGIDDHNAHVQPTGAYHYHGRPTGLEKILKEQNDNEMVLLGYAADGFPIYNGMGYSKATDTESALKQLTPSYVMKEGKRKSGEPKGSYDGTYTKDYEYKEGHGDLDECNGRFGVTPEYPEGIYHYHITTEFPMIPRFYKGTPDPSFKTHGPSQGRDQHEGPRDHRNHGDHRHPPHGHGEHPPHKRKGHPPHPPKR